MFSRRITDSARFLKMGAGAQLLYFHLCMHADDDGVVEAFTVRRGIGANEDDMSNLEGRGFIRFLDRENEIVLVNHWHEHNSIRKDRLTPSIYRGLIREVAPDMALPEPSQRKDRPKPVDVTPDRGGSAPDGQPLDGDGTSHGQPRGNHGATMGQPWGGLSEDKSRKDKTRKVKLGKDKTSEDKPKRTVKPFSPPSLQECGDYYREKGFTFDLEFFYRYFTELKWHDGNGKPVKSWKGKMLTWQHNDDERRKGSEKGQTSFLQHTEEENSEPWGWDE